MSHLNKTKQDVWKLAKCTVWWKISLSFCSENLQFTHWVDYFDNRKKKSLVLVNIRLLTLAYIMSPFLFVWWHVAVFETLCIVKPQWACDSDSIDGDFQGERP